MIAQKQQENYTTITGTNREEKNMENCKIVNLYNLDETIAKDLLLKFTYPWEALPHIKVLHLRLLVLPFLLVTHYIL